MLTLEPVPEPVPVLEPVLEPVPELEPVLRLPVVPWGPPGLRRSRRRCRSLQHDLVVPLT